jgi:uncharacterized membrane protein YidH (DUF202 family)
MLKKKIAYLGLAFILIGVLTLVFGGVGYSRQEKAMELGSIEANLEMPGKPTVPAWGSALFLAAGAGLVAAGLRRR